MGKVDYSKVSKITLEESGMFSKSSLELRKILFALRIVTVADFLRLIDNGEFKQYKFKDTLMEALGLASLLKQEYFDIPIDNNINFASQIKYMFFDEVSVWLYGIKTNDHKQINIYSLITLLGFNAEERDKILDVEERFLEDRLLIDLLYNTYVRLMKYGEVDDAVLMKKISVILKHYIVYYKDDRCSNFMKDFYIGLEEFHDLLILNNKSKSDNNTIKR